MLAAGLAGAALAQSGQESGASSGLTQTNLLERATAIDDPTRGPVAVYGGLFEPSELDVYSFIASREATVPVEALVPARVSNRDFRPTVAVIGPGLGSLQQQVPFDLPASAQAEVIPPSDKDKRDAIVEPLSIEKLYRGNAKAVKFVAGQRYYIVAYAVDHRTGDYVIGFGDEKSFSRLPAGDYVGQGLALKFGLADGRSVPVLDLVALLLTLAGLIIGLGAATVMDAFAIRSLRPAYWTELSIKASRATVPLTWAGVAVFLVGTLLLYREAGFSGVGTFQQLLLLVIVVNGLLMTFRLVPELRKREAAGKAASVLPRRLKVRVAVHFIVSFGAWWGQVGLLSWYLLVSR